jgi:predicted nucleotidyltransferase
MTRDQAAAKIAINADALRARGVGAVYVFKPATGPDSRFDIYIDIAPSAKFSLLDLAGVHRLLNKTIGRKVDVATRENIHSTLRTEIEQNAIRVF